MAFLELWDTVYPRFGAPGCLFIFEVFGGALTRAGCLPKHVKIHDAIFSSHSNFTNTIIKRTVTLQILICIVTSLYFFQNSKCINDSKLYVTGEN